MSRILFSHRHLLSTVLVLGLLPLAADVAPAAPPAKIPGFPAAPTPATLNNGSLKTSINPHFLQANGTPTPGQLPFSQIAGMNEDLRLVCNGVPIEPSRLVSALDGFPGGGNSVIIPNPNFPACLAQNPNCQPFFLVNTGTAVTAPQGSINVLPWFPSQNTIYQICGFGGGRDPRANMMAVPNNPVNDLPPQAAKGCCGSPLQDMRPAATAARSLFSFPAYNANYGPGLVSNYFGAIAGYTPFFATSSVDAPGVSTYTPFGGNATAAESDADKKEPTKDSDKPASNK